jgi:hypothetical protein
VVIFVYGYKIKPIKDGQFFIPYLAVVDLTFLVSGIILLYPQELCPFNCKHAETGCTRTMFF